jgi:hypothetical protein
MTYWAAHRDVKVGSVVMMTDEMVEDSRLWAQIEADRRARKRAADKAAFDAVLATVRANRNR